VLFGNVIPIALCITVPIVIVLALMGNMHGYVWVGGGNPWAFIGIIVSIMVGFYVSPMLASYYHRKANRLRLEQKFM
jgi:hypothetical protein